MYIHVFFISLTLVTQAVITFNYCTFYILNSFNINDISALHDCLVCIEKNVTKKSQKNFGVPGKQTNWQKLSHLKQKFYFGVLSQEKENTWRGKPSEL